MDVVSDEDVSVKKLSSDKKYFDYHKRPEEITLDEYLKVYDAFCKAYGIKIDEDDKKKFSNELDLNIYLKAKRKYRPDGTSYIYSRHSIIGINHRPISAGNKLNAMLMVTPLHGYVRFGAFSYNGGEDPVKKFIIYADNSLHNSKNLESKVK